MDLTRLFFSVCGFLCSTLWITGVVGFVCQSPQYIEIKSTGKIECMFPESLYSVFWYNSTDVFHGEAVVTLLDSVKSGQGFLSGEFDIHPNGALIINNVTLEHEGTYTAIVLETPSRGVIRYTVNVSVVAPAFIPLPCISRCNKTSELCFQILNRHSEISCSIQDARPAVTLMWIVRTNSGDLNISSHLSISNESFSFFTSRVTTTNPFVYSSRLTLLVCKATSPPGLLESYESYVLIQNSEIVFPASPVKKYVNIKDKLELNCTDNHVGYLVWQRKHYFESAFSNVVVAVLSGGNFQTQIGEDDYTLTASGMLVVNDVNTHHESVYRCISGDGLEDGVVIYEVVLFAIPVPTYLVVEGCDHQQYCVLEAQPEESLQCSVRGIRPEVNIEFRPLDEKTSASVHFYENDLTVTNNGDLLDISLISKYRLNDDSQTRMTIQCRVIETDIQQLLLSTNFDLVVKDRMTSTEKNSHNTKDELEEKRYYWIAIIVLAVLLLFSIPFYKLTANRKRQQRSNLRVVSAEDPLMILLSGGQDKTQMFTSELKEKYRDLYDAVQPTPYFRDRLYCVDRVFVESGIEYLDTKGRLDREATWKKLDSYQNILFDFKIKSTRVILEGDPGFGKSTLTLQLAYDWCNGVGSPLLREIDILVLLKLRQLGEVKSIYRAIKKTLLPRDSQLSENDIQNILSKSTRVVVILDGFDEFPDQDRDVESDVINIIARKMFQNFQVILTTRSSCLPKEYPALTKRLRLTGFGEIERDHYIRKAVVGDDSVNATKIKQLLTQNPFLEDICQVPLFFVMFAHLSLERQYFHTCSSVTALLRFLISCFHYHMKNKMKDEKVGKYDLLETDHMELDKLAFEGLRSENKSIVWSKSYVLERLGQDFYHQYVGSGILLEEEILNISIDPSAIISEHIQYKTVVRFYHKLFCEWYAAHYLSSCVSKEYETLNTVEESKEESVIIPHQDKATNSESFQCLKHLDPRDCNYVYRFACGLNPTASKVIIAYLKEEHRLQNYAILCILEQIPIPESLLSEVQYLCTREMIINKKDSLLLQRSTIQLLEFASVHKISVASVCLFHSYGTVNKHDQSSEYHIQLKSNLSLPVVTTLMELWIRDTDIEITLEDVTGIFHYSSLCDGFKKLRFVFCRLPRAVQTESLSLLQSRNIEVFWTGFHSIYRLNLASGLWEHEDKGTIMADEEYQREVSFLGKPSTRDALEFRSD